MAQAMLYIGEALHLREHVRAYLDARVSDITYDTHGRGKHSALTWIARSGRQHKREDLHEIFYTTAYARDADDPMYIVLEDADCLTHAAANSMLKLLEEPPTGYIFILLAASEDSVIPTIRSRCHIYRFVSQQSYAHHVLYQLFTQHGDLHMYQSYSVIDDDVPSEHETRILVEALLQYWFDTYYHALEQGVRHRVRMAERMLVVLRNAIAHLPVSGNVKVFWRTVFVHVHMIKGA